MKQTLLLFEQTPFLCLSTPIDLKSSDTGMTSQACYIFEVKERKGHKTGKRAW